MATKPSTIPRVWASSALYTNGPFIGDVMKVDPGAGIAAAGHRPGANSPTAAEHENYQQNQLTKWVADWLYLGTSGPLATAHLQETDATGRAGILGVDITDPNDETALNVTSANTLAPGSLFTCTTGATAVQAAIGNSTGVGFAAPIGSGAGAGFVSRMTGSAFGAFGVDVSADNATSGYGIKTAHAGTGYALEAVSTGPLPAVNITTSTTSTTAAFITGGSTRALLATSATTAGTDAIHGALNAANTTGKAIRAYMAAAATSASRGFYCLATGSGVAAEFSAPLNNALIVTGDATSPQYAPLVITEQNARPVIATTAGSIAVVRSSFGVAAQTMESCPEDNNWRGHLSTVGGSALGVAYTASATRNSAGTWGSLLSIYATGGDCPKTAGRQILMRISMSARQGVAATALILNLRLLDITAGGGVVWTRSGTGSGAGAGWTFPTLATADWHPPIMITVPITVPGDGDYQWNLEFGHATAGGVSLRDISVDFLGMT
jgi:hypothetical protein